MTTKVEIANRALQRVGAKRIGSFEERSREAEAVAACYDFLKRAELSQSLWTFAIRRVQLAPDATPPSYGRANQYTLPPGYLRRAPDDPTYDTFPTDYLIEGGKLLTDVGTTLELRYVDGDVDESMFHPLFADALSMRIGAEICEELTQSSAKLDRLENAYNFTLMRAKRINAIEGGPINDEIDEFVAVRFSGSSDPTTRRYS